MADSREALQTQRQAGFRPRGIDQGTIHQFPNEAQLREWRGAVGLPDSIPLTPITVNRWQVSPDGLAMAAGLAVGAVVFGGDNKTPNGKNISQPDQSSEPLVLRGRLSRRRFLQIATIGGAGAVLAACMPGSDPQPRPTEGKLSAAPTPTVDINPNLLVSLRTDVNFVDNQTWGRKTFGPQMDALARQFSPERVKAMRMNVSGALGEGNKLLGYAFDVLEGAKRYLYFGADQTGSGGAYVAIPDAATIAVANGVEIGFPINQKQDRFVHKYVDQNSNYLDPRMGMMVGAGSGVTVDAKEINTFLSDISQQTSDFVKDQVLAQKDDQALFTLKVKYDDKGNQLFGVFEEVNDKNETSIYVISKKTGIHKLEQVQGYTYQLNKTTGEIELYQDGQLAGRVKSVGSTGQVQVEIPGIDTATPKATDTLTPTATATITLTPNPTATPRPTETQRPPTFHEILDQKGITLGVDVDNHNNINTNGQTISDNFNMVIPGYFSWGWIRRNGQDVNTIDLGAADKWANFAFSKGMRVRNGNPLVYNVDLPDWLTKGNFTKEQLSQILTDHVSTVVGHYKGKASEWIVANEAYIYYQGYKGIQTKINGSNADFPFATQIGGDYIDLAFQAARKADPNATLIYNDFGIEVGGPKADWIFENVKRLKDKGLVDAVGFQMHLTQPPNLDAANPPTKDQIISQIKRYKDIGVNVIVTELDVDARRLSGTQEQKLARQAEIYRMVVEACLEGGCKSISVWGLNDADSYLGAGASALLFSDNKPKPAFQAIQQVVSQH